MRISDWSSDVCSSDLIVLRRTEDGRGDSEFRYHNAESFFLSIERGIVHERFDLLCQTGIVIQLGLSAHLFDVGFTDDWCRRYIGLRITKSLAYANATGFDYDNPDINLLADRSEEHTSELQSLMRISYAVFCLKKKKN